MSSMREDVPPESTSDGFSDPSPTPSGFTTDADAGRYGDYEAYRSPAANGRGARFAAPVHTPSPSMEGPQPMRQPGTLCKNQPAHIMGSISTASQINAQGFSRSGVLPSGVVTWLPHQPHNDPGDDARVRASGTSSKETPYQEQIPRGLDSGYQSEVFDPQSSAPQIDGHSGHGRLDRTQQRKGLHLYPSEASYDPFRALASPLHPNERFSNIGGMYRGGFRGDNSLSPAAETGIDPRVSPLSHVSDGTLWLPPNSQHPESQYDGPGNTSRTSDTNTPATNMIFEPEGISHQNSNFRLPGGNESYTHGSDYSSLGEIYRYPIEDLSSDQRSTLVAGYPTQLPLSKGQSTMCQPEYLEPPALRLYRSTGSRDQSEGPTLICGLAGCKTSFTGQYKKGNLGRHQRTTHGGLDRSGQILYCEEPGCDKSFKRTDARLKHYRGHHKNRCRGPVSRKP